MELTREETDLLRDPAKLRALSQDELRALYTRAWQAQPLYGRWWQTARMWCMWCVAVPMMHLASWLQRRRIKRAT